MKVFITGGTGNIGQYVTKAFLEAGHSVVLLTRTPDRIPAYLTMENVEVVKGNMLDLDVMGKALQGCDAVVHIALGWGNDPLEMLDHDTRVTAYLLNAADKAGVKNFVYTSSTAALGPLRNGMDETALRIPENLYGATKAASEAYVIGFRHYYGSQGNGSQMVKMRRNIIRPGYTYSNPAVEGGASQSDTRFKKIAEDIVAGRDIIWSKNDGTQFLSSRQIAQLYLKLTESDLNEEIFFALSHNFVSWYDIACVAKEMVPESPSKIIAPDEEEVAPSLYGVGKMERVFGLKFDAWEDLREHIAWNVERAKAEAAGQKVHNVLHVW